MAMTIDVGELSCPSPVDAAAPCRLSTQPSFVDGVAVGETETLEIDAEQLHALLVAEAVLARRFDARG